MKKSIFNVCVLFVTFLSMANIAYAQAMPLLSDPIKVLEFERMSEKLDMTLLQQEAAIDVYDRYLDNFSSIRQGSIRAFEDSIAEASETFGFMNFSIPERELVEDLIRKAQRAMKAIHQTDSLFFEEVAGMLTEKQRASLGRIQISRELEAYEVFIQFMIGELNNGARARMRQFYDSLDLEPNEELDEMMDLYDQRYLKEVKQGFEAVLQTIALLLDMIDELGLRGQDQQALMMKFMMDPEAIEDLKKRGDVLLKPLVDQAYSISQLNWKTWKKLDAILGNEDASALQKRYYSTSFKEAMSGGAKINNYLERALKHEGILESQKIDLEALQNSFSTKWKKKTMQYADILEKSRQIQTVATMSGESTTEFTEKLATLENDRAVYIQTAEDRIDTILGNTLAKVLKKKDSPRTRMSFGPALSGNEEGDSSGSVQIIVGSTTTGDMEMTEEELEALLASGEFETLDGSGSMVVSSSVAFGEPMEIEQAHNIEGVDTDSAVQFSMPNSLQGNSSIPKPIAPTFPERAPVVLDLDENGEIIITAVYDEYREKYGRTDKEIKSKFKHLSEDKEITRVLRKRKTKDLSDTAASLVADLDTVFFDDLAAITNLKRDDVNLKMLEDHRRRQRESVPDDPFGWGGGEGDTIDLVGLYIMSDLSEELHEGLSNETISAIRNSMQKYHGDIAHQHETFMQAQTEMTRMQDAMWFMDESDPGIDMAETMQRKWATAFADVRDSKRSYMLANQEVMDALLKEVPESDFWKVRMKFVNKAYPDVFRQSSDISTMLASAVAIQSLNVEQKSKIETLAERYRNDYWNLCELMIENHQSSASAKSGDSMVSKEDTYRQLKLETLRFDRKELNDRVQMRLRMILGEDQIKVVPGLRPTVTASVDNN